MVGGGRAIYHALGETPIRAKRVVAERCERAAWRRGGVAAGGGTKARRVWPPVRRPPCDRPAARSTQVLDRILSADYHFKSKDALWRAAADRVFGLLQKSLGEHLDSLELSDPRERARETIRAYVRFVAAQSS